MKEIFKEKPIRWGLRGDPHLWQELETRLANLDRPDTAVAFASLLEKLFEEITGASLSDEGTVYIEAFNSGGMSGGLISLAFWRETGVPQLISNYERMAS